jgi:LysR family hydrogen peroxide-inducible transcriptional activator
MTLTQLRYLCALADHGHFGRAAEASGVSQPTLSAQIARLEGYLDAPLVVRGGGGATLTPLGESVLARARQMLDLAEEVKGAARRADEPLVGPFRLGVIPTFCPYFLPWALPALRRRFARLDLITRELRTEDALAALRRRELDAAVVAAPVDQRVLRALPLFDEPFMAAMPLDHKLASAESVAPAALADERLLVLEEGHCLRDQTLGFCEAGAPDPSGTRATSLETLLGLVAVGEGVTLAPALAVEGRRGTALCPLDPPAMRRMVLVHAAGSARRDEMRLLAEALRAAAPTGLSPLEG